MLREKVNLKQYVKLLKNGTKNLLKMNIGMNNTEGIYVITYGSHCLFLPINMNLVGWPLVFLNR